jgi:hypothetical protein
MSNEIKWTAKPFYIQSKINGSNYVLTASGGGVKTIPLQSTIDNMWKASPDPRGGAFLIHLGTGLVLARNGESLALQALNTGNSGQLWRVEDLGSPWVGINSYTDWEQKINVYRSNLNGTTGLYHWDGGADNEKWLILDEDGTLATQQMQYFIDRATTDVSDPPSKMIATSIDNVQGAKDVTSTVALQRVITTSRQLTESTADTTGRKYTQTFAVKGGVKDVWEVSANFSFEESSSTTRSFSDQSTDTTSSSDTVSVNVTVPAGKKYRYQVAVYSAKYSIPFTATLSFTSSVPGSQPITTTIDGTYNGVNATHSEVEVADITAARPNSAAVAVVKRIAVPIGKQAQRAAA